MVLLFSSKQQPNYLYLEVSQDASGPGASATIGPERSDVGWFDQAWYAEMSAQSADKKSTAYTLRNIRTGEFLQVGKQLPDGSMELTMAPKHQGPARKTHNAQIWDITDDDGITSLATKQALELVGPDATGSWRACLRDNDPTNNEGQTWRYMRVSRSARDVTDAMTANGHLQCKLIEYQSTDATYLTLPPDVRDEIWETTGLGKDPLKWRKQIFDWTHDPLRHNFWAA
ncbi:hypothetical protein Neosp_013487 [[Neocosmospora] mangrovei]